MSALTCDEIWHVAADVSTVELTQETPPGGSNDDVIHRTEQVSLRAAVAENTLLLSVSRSERSISPRPAWDTLQVSESEHAKFGNKALKLNHARDPNTRIALVFTSSESSESALLFERVDVVSTREIRAGEALTFNYNTTEWEMADPFVDWATGESVGGFSRASQEEQAALLASGLVLPHIRDKAGAMTEKRT
jgi:SET domain